MELVYPIYLDTQMMTSFLASLKGGLIEEASVEGKTANVKQKAGKGSVGAKVSNLISAFVDASAQAEITGGIAENVESQYRGTLRFPEATLFIELRNLLLEQKIIKNITSSKDFNKINIGDIIEIQGIVKPSPSYELRRVITQLTPVIIPTLEIQIAQTENEIADFKKLPVKNKSGGKTVQVGDTEFSLSSILSGYEYQIKQKRNQIDNIKGLETVVDRLFIEDSATNVLFESNDFKSVCKVYPAFARNHQVQEIFESNWRCIGKVIGKMEPPSSYDLFKGLPVGLIAKEIFSGLVESLKSEELQIDISNPIISGSILIIAPLSIFA